MANNSKIITNISFPHDSLYILKGHDTSISSTFDLSNLTQDRTITFPDTSVMVNKASDFQAGNDAVDISTTSGDIIINANSDTGNIVLTTGVSGATQIVGKKVFSIENSSANSVNFDYSLAASKTAYFDLKLTCYSDTQNAANKTQFSITINGHCYRLGTANIAQVLNVQNVYGTQNDADVNVSATGTDTIRVSLAPTQGESSTHYWKGVIEFITNDDNLTRVS